MKRLHAHRTLTIALAVAFTPIAAQAQQNQEPQRPPSKIWGVSTPTGSFHVRLDRITSVSKAEYLIEGNIMVTEVTVDTMGQTTARFYYGEPYIPKTKLGITENAANRARDLANTTRQRVSETDMEVDRLVVKSYGPPNTTHAKTIEFKVASIKELNQIYKNVFDSWTTGRGRNLKVNDE